jgi:DNA-binding PadR family transcriptional regulator
MEASKNMTQSKAQSKQNLIQGTLAMLILRALARGPLHGYEIAQRIQAKKSSANSA